MKMEINVSDDQMNDIVNQVKKDIVESVTDETVFEIISDPSKMIFTHLMDGSNLSGRFYNIKDKKVSELDNDDKLLLMSFWMYDAIRGRYL